MSKLKDEQVDKRKNFFIPIDGKLYETSEEIYRNYYRMDRRERYLEERSRKHELSYEALTDVDYPIEEKMVDQPEGIEDEVITSILIEKILLVISQLSEEEKQLIQELFFCGKSEVALAKEIGIARTTIQSRKYKILSKIKKLLKN
ncbi:sigma-70 family RNA polymerase sigma factor [Lutibacter sp. B2]|nr:sigma-70 family RNA polymerase sigma factor [Lutibacter sp. B2]